MENSNERNKIFVEKVKFPAEVFSSKNTSSWGTDLAWGDNTTGLINYLGLSPKGRKALGGYQKQQVQESVSSQ